MRYAIAMCLVLLSGVTSHAQTLTKHTRVTLLQVLANPEQYDGKDFQVIGYLHLEFEGNGLYLHKEDYDHSLGNMIWVDATPEMNEAIKDINDKYVIIRGVFDAKRHGHMSMFLGTMTKITRCDVWSDPKKQKRSD